MKITWNQSGWKLVASRIEKPWYRLCWAEFDFTQYGNQGQPEFTFYVKAHLWLCSKEYWLRMFTCDTGDVIHRVYQRRNMWAPNGGWGGLAHGDIMAQRDASFLVLELCRQLPNLQELGIPTQETGVSLKESWEHFKRPCVH